MIKRNNQKNHGALVTITMLLLLTSMTSLNLMADTKQPSTIKHEQIVPDQSIKQAINEQTMKINTSKEKVQQNKQQIKDKADRQHSEVTININSASISELQEMSGIGQEKAAMIVEYRKNNGHFKTIDELEKVPGIGKKTINKNRQWLAVE